MHPLSSAVRSLILTFLILSPLTRALAAGVVTQRTPDSGIQPQLVRDADGRLHLLYYTGPTGGGDLFYARTTPGRRDFATPTRVNSESGSAIATGTIRGGQLAVGRDGRAHVVWNGAKSIPNSSYEGVPMWYARSDVSGTRFESQRNLITHAGGLDGGGDVTIDSAGNIHVFWHGASATNTAGESGRAVFITTSTNAGSTFPPERVASPDGTGACGCCGMGAFADSGGRLFALYRSAATRMDRDELLVMSGDGGRTFTEWHRAPWKTASCPMSSAAFAESPLGIHAAWEVSGQIQFTTLPGTGARPGKLAVNEPPGTGRSKHPAIAVNARGETLLAWAEGTGWQRGGALAWQIFDPQGRPTEQKGRVAGGVPVWGLVAAVALGNGDFLIVH